MVLTKDQQVLQQGARRFARERLLPDYQKREREAVLERELVAEMGRLGLLGMDLPQEVSGMGADAVTTGLVVEELAYGDFNVSALPVGISLNGAILVRHAQPEVVSEWVPRLTRGDAVPAICLTEPRGGSDASNLQLRARRDQELPHQQRMRDVMGLEIGDGTAGIMKLIVARERIGRAAIQY